MNKLTILAAAAAALLPVLNASAGRDAAQLRLQDELNRRVAAERKQAPPTAEQIQLCRATARKSCPDAAG
jgi:hypothetical protein